ncbi:MAG: aminopeptidase [Candidatus Muiribacterium halophilum]|uniref:Aminopeptidase n=1 Tax=Muiribacterium halophilum TaxID=2053465 RepID=A0A2N5ZB48_MUIH1|nr:MAG: aminopeptidase [Candidatus Muirbacterium halophilum]
MDKRILELAKIIVNHSCDVKKGEKVLITGGQQARPLIGECFREVIRCGGHPTVRVTFPETDKMLFDLGDEQQIAYQDPIRKYTYENIDALINISAPENLKMLSSVEPAKQVMRTKANKELMDIIMTKKWLIVNYPTNALAQEAGMSLEEYQDFVFGATNIDWKKAKARMEEIKKVFDAGKQVKVLGRDTELTFSIEGRPGIVCAGENNMPDGEVFYSPIEDSVNGEIYYEFPGIYQSREVDGIRLKFENGKVVDAKANKNEEFLEAILNTDKGARFLGEFGIGLNYGIKDFSKDILFDEKIGGTVHFAVGQSYEEAGGKNVSAIHWDMVKDLRKHGQIYVDGKLVQQNGEFLI